MKPHQITNRTRYLVGVSFISGKYTLKELALKYGICEATASKIISEKLKKKSQ